MKIKRLLVLTLIFMMLLSLNAYADTIKFNDVTQEDWFYKNLINISDKNIIVGYPDGTFKPNNNLKFEEFIKMVVVAVNENNIGQVQGQEWHQIYIDKALESKYISEEQKALIGQNIDRKTMAEILFNVLINQENITLYTDKELEYINTLLKDLNIEDNKILTIAGQGIICGYPDGTFKSNDLLTRSETVAVISRLIDKEQRLPIDINLPEPTEPIAPTETKENNIDLKDLPPVDLSHLYDYPTLSGNSVKEENQYYYRYGEEYVQTVINDYINFMWLMHNRDYLANINKNEYKNQMIYYLNGYKEYKGKEYSKLKSYYIDYYTKTNNKEMLDFVLSQDFFIENFVDTWLQDTLNNKVKVQAKFYTENGLLHSADGYGAIRGILRIKYDSHNNPSNIKEELDLVQREVQKSGQINLNLDKSRYDIYLSYEEIPDFKVGKWYEIEIDIVVSSQSFAHGLDDKAKLNYKYIYPIAIRELK